MQSKMLFDFQANFGYTGKRFWAYQNEPGNFPEGYDKHIWV